MRLTRNVHVHRLSGTAIVLIVAVAAIVAGAIGTAIASVSSKAPPFPVSAFQVGKLDPSQTPATSSSTITTPFGTIPVPPGYTVAHQTDASVELTGPDHATVTVSTLAQPADADRTTLQEQLIASDRRTLDPNAQLCADDRVDTTFTLSGTPAPIPAVFVPLCLSVVPQNGAAFTARDYYYAGVASSAGQPVAVVISIFADTDAFPGVVDNLAGFAAAVHWTATVPQAVSARITLEPTTPR